MAFIGLRVPPELGRLLNTIEVPGEHVSGDTYHVTIAVLNDEVPIDDIAKATKAVFEVASKQKPFQVSLGKVSAFPGNSKGFPIICLAESPELHELHAGITASLDAAGIEYSKKFPEYKPHVTLSYAQEEVEIPFESPIVWTAYEVVLWGGDKGDERLSVTFPFSLPGKTALWRKLIQAHLKFGPGA